MKKNCAGYDVVSVMQSCVCIGVWREMEGVQLYLTSRVESEGSLERGESQKYGECSFAP